MRRCSRWPAAIRRWRWRGTAWQAWCPVAPNGGPSWRASTCRSAWSRRRPPRSAQPARSAGAEQVAPRVDGALLVGVGDEAGELREVQLGEELAPRADLIPAPAEAMDEEAPA